MDKKQKITELINKEVKKIITEAKDKIKKKKIKKATLEGLTVESCANIEKDDLGRFYVVTDPTKNMNANIVFETDLFNFTEKVQKGEITLENIKGIFKKEDRANRLKERLVRTRKKAISDAKNSAEKLKGLKDEVINKTNALKQVKSETVKAISKIK